MRVPKMLVYGSVRYKVPCARYKVPNQGAMYNVPNAGGRCPVREAEVQVLSLVTIIFFSICILYFSAVFVPSRPLRFSHQNYLEEGG